MSSYKEGQVHQLVEALEEASFTADDLTKLGQFPDKKALQGVLRGTHKIHLADHFIDCSADPFVPQGWGVEEHRRTSKVKWDPFCLTLHLSENQKRGNNIEGHELRKELSDLAVANANVLDYLLTYPGLIPDLWIGLKVFFWGTIYRKAKHSSFYCVRCLVFHDGCWRSERRWFSELWYSNDPALVLTPAT